MSNSSNLILEVDIMSAIDGKIMATRSDCYKTGRKMTPKGIIVHSTGCNNPNIKRYVAPGNDDIGYNNNGNSMNEPGQDVCVHMIIGKNAKGAVKCYQILPFDICCWGVGSGWKGSYNYNPAYIQFEMCEDDLNDKTYCKACYDKAVAVCAELCKQYKLSVSNIKSHHEAGNEGMGSQHVDPDNWWGKHGFTMNGFRKAVEAKMKEKEIPVLDKTGYKRDDNTIGSLSLKELLIEAKRLGIQPNGMDENGYFGPGTEKAVNYLLKKWGYKETGIAGENFIKKLKAEIAKVSTNKNTVKMGDYNKDGKVNVRDAAAIAKDLANGKVK
jgi:N-acetylmuramoyl-L-alanine amidase